MNPAPVDSGSHRLLVPDGERTGPAVERVSGRDGDRWVIRSFEAARQVLRDGERIRQAGFGAEQMGHGGGAKMRPPVLYLEGAEHQVQRKAAARLFAPKVIEGYREMMQQLSDDLVGQLRRDRPVDLDKLSLTMAVQVAARVVGLTNSSPAGMTRRIEGFLQGGPPSNRRSPAAILRLVHNRTTLLRFFYLDVKPAIRARRRQPGDDVISTLLAQGFSDLDILTECVTYGAAGMATTREFITVAAWHLLDRPDLLARYRAAEMDERLEILSEILRLEPVIGHLTRRTTESVTLPTPDGDQVVPADALIDVDIRATNADPDTVGALPLSLCPARELPRSVPPVLMSFGDGHHKCPGGPMAIMESEIFLTTLLSRDVVSAAPPRVRWNALTQGYDLDRFLLRLAPPKGQ